MIKRREIRLNGEWQLDGRNQVYESTDDIHEEFFSEVRKILLNVHAHVVMNKFAVITIFLVHSLNKGYFKFKLNK